MGSRGRGRYSQVNVTASPEQQQQQLGPIWWGLLTPSCPSGPPAALSCDKKRTHASSTLPGHAMAGKCTLLKHFLNNGIWRRGNVLGQFCSPPGAAGVKMKETARTPHTPPVNRIVFAWAANINTLFPHWYFFPLTHCFSFSCDECSHLWTLGRIVYGTFRPSVWTHTVMEFMLVVKCLGRNFIYFAFGFSVREITWRTLIKKMLSQYIKKWSRTGKGLGWEGGGVGG